MSAPLTTLCLARPRLALPAEVTGLRRGDLLVGLDGQPFAGDAQDLAARLAEGDGRPRAFTFLRGGKTFTLLSPTAGFGSWEPAPRPEQKPELPGDPARLQGWHVIRQADGLDEMVPARTSLLALAAPALWLAQMRLWTWLGLLGAGLALALPGGILAMAAVWAAFGLHLWRNGAQRVIADRLALGGVMLGQIAAPGEMAAHGAWAALTPGARLRFAPSLRPAVAETPA